MRLMLGLLILAVLAFGAVTMAQASPSKGESQEFNSTLTFNGIIFEEHIYTFGNMTYWESVLRETS